METLTTRWSEVRGGSYYVKRGAISWPSFDFERRPRAVAIMADELLFLRAEAPMDVSFEVAASMPGPTEDPQIDEGLIDELADDTEWVVRKLIEAVDTQGDCVALRVAEQDARIIEWHDPTIRVQGIVAFFQVTF